MNSTSYYMLKWILMAIIVLVPNYSSAQKLSLKDLHIMSTNKNWETTNKYVLSQGWEFNNSEKGDDERYNAISWSFDKQGTDTERATSWLYVYSFDGLPNKVTYRFRAKDFYTAVRAQLGTYKYKLQNEEILDKKVVAHYSNSDFLLELEYIRVDNDEYSYEGSYTVYQVTVTKKGGVYDPNNGKKKEYDDDGNLNSEYFLKDGQIDGMVRVFNPDGTIRKTVTYVNGIVDGLSTEYLYDDNGLLRAKYSGQLNSLGKEGKWQLNRITEDAEINLSYTNFVNDVEEGSFRAVTNDSVIHGRFRGGKLHGKHDIFIDTNLAQNGIIETDTLKLKKISSGYFVDNKRNGNWKLYDLYSILIEDGTYKDDMKKGVWKYFYPSYVDNQGKTVGFAGKLYLEESYYADKLHGPCTRYAYLTDVEVPCDDGQQNCSTKRMMKITEQSNYFHGVREGLYELRSEAGQMIRKGQFANGNEEGEWFLRNQSTINPFKGETYETGLYKLGKKDGKWQRHDEDGSLLEVYHYLDGAIDGEHLLYISNRPAEKRRFVNGSFVGLSILDNALNETTTYRIEEVTQEKYRCIKIARSVDGVHQSSFSVKRQPESELSPMSFNLEFESLPSTVKILEGPYSHTGFDTKPLNIGTYSNNKKVGLWSSYYYHQYVRADFEYDIYGNLIREFYYDIKKDEPFSGEFIYKHDADSFIEERKIKHGLRNGTTRFKDAENKTIKKESYKDGVLKG